MSDPLTTVRTYYNPAAAEFVRGLLESFGIPAFLADENIARLYSGFQVRLQVRESDLPDARQILDAALPESAPGDEETLG